MILHFVYLCLFVVAFNALVLFVLFNFVRWKNILVRYQVIEKSENSSVVFTFYIMKYCWGLKMNKERCQAQVGGAESWNEVYVAENMH